MKTNLLVILSILAITLSACTQQKEEPVKKSVTEGTEDKAVVHKAKEAAPPVTNDAAQKINEPGKAADNVTKKPPSAGNPATEQALSETIEHAQAVTKTQKSEARQRGQKAVDEMMMEVEKK